MNSGLEESVAVILTEVQQAKIEGMAVEFDGGNFNRYN